MRMVAAVAVLAVLFALAACAGRDERDAGKKDGDRSRMESGGVVLAPPGLYDLPGGRKRALGTLEYRDLEGGFWVIVHRIPSREASSAPTIVVLANGREAGAPGLEGRYVFADGEMLEGVSIRMAGPEMRVESLREVTDTTVVPDGGE